MTAIDEDPELARHLRQGLPAGAEDLRFVTNTRGCPILAICWLGWDDEPPT